MPSAVCAAQAGHQLMLLTVDLALLSDKEWCEVCPAGAPGEGEWHKCDQPAAGGASGARVRRSAMPSFSPLYRKVRVEFHRR
ncbi:hypothetical protein GCM10017776_10300 [Streptomyces griseoluteus]|nr:hypothetical protein GCM10017776_10300 [Streptomyces griseoluteus]